MADAAVGFVVEKLRDLIVKEAVNLYGVRDEVEWLERELGRMQCFLKDADAKKNDNRVKHWVTEMRDLAFEAEDIIDTFMYYKLRREQGEPGCIGFIKWFVFIFDELVSKHKVHVDVEGIKTKLQELSRSREVYGISNIGTTSQSRSPGEIPILPQLRDDIDMVGFDDEKKKIVQELVDVNNANLSVISIVGMGGLGKTTLAKSIYNDHKVKRSFDMFAWVIISQQYTILEILKVILSGNSETSLEDTIQTLSVKVFEKLKKGKYLVVLVSTKPQTKDAWHKVVDSMKSQFVEGGERCLEILALSFNDLPYYLKSCFLYFGCFKEDARIFTEKIIRLWSAEGFLPTKNDKTIEEFGYDCLEELAQRCLIQVTEREYDDSAKLCRIHDLLRDLCISEAKENKFLEICQNDTADCATISNAARRLIIFNKMETLNYSNPNLRGLRFYEHIDYDILKGCLGRFKLLRVLHLENEDMPEIPYEIKSLIHLKYLQLDFKVLKKVPSWIGHLLNLQTFIVSFAELEKISDSLWTIGNLRHVDLSMLPEADPPNMRNNVPKNLQTLKCIKAGSWIGETLPKLTNLCELSIGKVSNDHADALSSSLQKLGHLASLDIDGFPSVNIISAFSNQHCLKNLSLCGSFNRKQLPRNDVFPQQLVTLYLEDSKLEQDPMATLEKLPCLKYLQLNHAYTGKQMICSATGFPQLLSLVIWYLNELEEWKIEENAMSCLKSLLIYRCERLEMIPEGLKNVPLEKLQLYRMPEEFLTRIKENTGEDRYKIQHVPNINIILF